MLGAEIATAYFVGWIAGPTGLIALTTGLYWFPQPAAKRLKAAAEPRRIGLHRNTLSPRKALRYNRLPNKSYSRKRARYSAACQRLL